MRVNAAVALTSATLLCLLGAAGRAQAPRATLFEGSPDDPGIRYSSARPANVVEALNAQLDAGTARLTFETRSGYLRSALTALGLAPESQLLVFSDASLQGPRISEKNPRAVFFNDRVQLGWVRDADLIEVAAQDATLGVVFYTLEQKATATPRFRRQMFCLGCHRTRQTQEVPGLVLFTSTRLNDGGRFASAAYMTPSTPMQERFGGWFVTGDVLPPRHAGASPAGQYDADGYAASTSDIAALMVFAHQVQTTNAMTRAGWEARLSRANETRQRQAAAELVDHLLFVDEARWSTPVRGSGAFAARFAAQAPRDRAGRSLRDLDLSTRLMRYPCSYLMYSPMFDALPPGMKSMVYERLWRVLSGAEPAARYRAALSLQDRRAVVEILRDTKPDLPVEFWTHIK